MVALNSWGSEDSAHEFSVLKDEYSRFNAQPKAPATKRESMPLSTPYFLVAGASGWALNDSFQSVSAKMWPRDSVASYFELHPEFSSPRSESRGYGVPRSLPMQRQHCTF